MTRRPDMQTPEREKIRIAILEFVKRNPGKYTCRTILRKIGVWDQSYSTRLYKLFALLEQTDLIRYERTGDGLRRVFPGKNAEHFNA